ncbi:histidine kinase [Streptomyces sp. TRM66268-LWL]|uniref:histidine kinase n=1 Tax=Streptomyces polyasparticus TaxID=2767826 RepID=A0ABR7SI54_9ACTN|nr:histidine kinase [Streptomyces polyasparticus]MBC9715113.1 histidine kinase [Streptomyces polyasparticus]
MQRIREQIRNWLPPVLLAGLQLALWQRPELRDGEAIGHLDLAVCLAVTVVAGVALGLRRGFPVGAALAVEAGLLTGLVAVEAATLLTSLAVVLALHTVAVRRPLRTAVTVTTVLLASSSLRCLVRYDSLAEAGGETLVNLALYAAAVGLGRGRAHWHAGRKAAALDLRRAEAARAAAATGERTRLARELHDVSAHHLTSVVVTVDAARRLRERRPELAEEALRFAAHGGRDTAAALHRLVAAMRTSAADEESALEDRIAELVGGCARLGLRPSVDIAPGAAALTGPVAEAAFGIVREALTNALRYAPSTAVRVVVGERDGVLELTVEDDGTPAAGESAEPDACRPPCGLGSGRGTQGMRERAAALGGTLESGPRQGATGWLVRASLPDTPAAGRRRHQRQPERVADLAVVLALTALPFAVFLAVRPDLLAVAALPAVLHALPLLWRRRSPWPVLCAVLATAWFAPLSLAVGWMPEEGAWALALGGGLAECVALHAVAAYGGRAVHTWPALPATAAGLALTFGAVGELSAFGGDVEDSIGFLVFVTLAGAVVLSLFLAPVWALGAVVRARRERVRWREGGALAATVQAAVVEAYKERQLIAAELRGAVLRHADAVVERAGAGDLDGVAEQARAGLAAMRELLAALRETAAPGSTPESAPARPQPAHVKETPPSLSEC